MKRLALALLPVVLLSVACGGDDEPSTQAPAGTGDGTTAEGSGPAPSGPAAQDPTQVDGCSLLTQEQRASVLGNAEGEFNPNASSTEVQDCQWYDADGRSIGYQVHLVDDPAVALRRDGSPVAVGNEAYLESAQPFTTLVADINGWYVIVTDLSGDVDDDALLAVGRLLEGALVPRSQAGTPGTGGDAGTAAGSIVALEFTVDAPAELAGTMTLDLLNAAPGGTSMSMCITRPEQTADFGYLFNYAYEAMGGGEGSPVPVRSAGFTIDPFAGPGTYEAAMTLATGIDQTVSGAATLVVDEGLSTGTFTLPDGSGGTISGSWRCEVG